MQPSALCRLIDIGSACSYRLQHIGKIGVNVVEAEATGRVLRRRLMIAGMLLAIVYAIGTTGYYLLGQGRWSVEDCLYMTVISLTTVGYGETLKGLHDVAYARLFTGILLVAGAGIALYFVSVLTTFLVEGEFLQL